MPLHRIPSTPNAEEEVARFEGLGEVIVAAFFERAKRLDERDHYVIFTQPRYATSPPRSYETRVAGIGGVG